MTTTQNPPAGASDAAIAQAFREFDQCGKHTAEECAAYNKVFNRAREIEATPGILGQGSYGGLAFPHDATLASKAEGDTTGVLVCVQHGPRFVKGCASCEQDIDDMEATPPAQVAGSGMGDVHDSLVRDASFETWFDREHPETNALHCAGNMAATGNKFAARQGWNAALAAQPAPVRLRVIFPDGLVQLASPETKPGYFEGLGCVVVPIYSEAHVALEVLANSRRYTAQPAPVVGGLPSGWYAERLPDGDLAYGDDKSDMVRASKHSVIGRFISDLLSARTAVEGGEAVATVVYDTYGLGRIVWNKECGKGNQPPNESKLYTSPAAVEGAQGASGGEHPDAETIRSYAGVLDGMALCKPRTAEQFNLTTSADLLRAYADSLTPPPATGSGGDDGAERCESGDPACGPVEFHDSEGVPLCKVCWDGLLSDAAP